VTGAAAAVWAKERLGEESVPQAAPANHPSESAREPAAA
jgi:hypothetical protein